MKDPLAGVLRGSMKRLILVLLLVLGLACASDAKVFYEPLPTSAALTARLTGVLEQLQARADKIAAEYGEEYAGYAPCAVSTQADQEAAQKQYKRVVADYEYFLFYPDDKVFDHYKSDEADFVKKAGGAYDAFERCLQDFKTGKKEVK